MRGKLTLVLTLGTLTLAALLGAARPKAPDEVKARRFTVVDQAGIPALTLAVDPEGNPTIALASKTGSGEIALRTSREGHPTLVLLDGTVSVVPSGLQIADAAGMTRASVETSRDGATALVLFDGSRRPAARLRVAPDGGTALEAFDRGGERVITIGHEEGGARVAVSGLRGHAVMGVLADGSATLSMDQDSKSRLAVSAASDGPVRLSLNDRNGRSRASITVQPGGVTEVVPASTSRSSE